MCLSCSRRSRDFKISPWSQHFFITLVPRKVRFHEISNVQYIWLEKQTFHMEEEIVWINCWPKIMFGLALVESHLSKKRAYFIPNLILFRNGLHVVCHVLCISDVSRWIVLKHFFIPFWGTREVKKIHSVIFDTNQLLAVLLSFCLHAWLLKKSAK